MARQITYEVYTLQSGRWEIYSRFPQSQKDAAIQEAKTLEGQMAVGSAKVIREVYDPDEGTAEESTVYKSAKEKEKSSPKPKTGGRTRSSSGNGASRRVGGRSGKSRAASAKRQPTGVGTKSPDDGLEEDKPAAPQARRTSSAGLVLIKLLFVALFSFGIASAVTYMFEQMLPFDDLFGLSLVGQSRATVILIVFVVVFLGSAVPMTVKSLSNVNIDLEAELRRAAARRGDATDKKAEFVPSPNADEETEKEKELRESLEAESKSEEEGEGEDKKLIEEEDLESEEEVPEELNLSIEAEKQKVFMMKFLGQSVQQVKANQETMDNFHKFGAALYLAGANEALSKKENLDIASASIILSENVQVLGYKKVQADRFADTCDEYLLTDSRYMQMYEAGRTSMNTFMSGDEAEGAKGMERALVEWNKPKPKEQRSGPITVMFTDMVGSTSLTQTRGDAVAQQVVRAHNRVVREALNRYRGKEIKHTGDGIMASFGSTSDSVGASVFIQQGTENHNESNPDLPLHLKIGLNAGEPIAEEDDLFGTTVQLAARIVDKARAGQIFVSEIIRGICAGKDIQFTQAGQFQMKGIEEPVTLYEVVWEGSPTAASPDAVPAAAVVVDGATAEDQAADTVAAALAADGEQAQALSAAPTPDATVPGAGQPAAPAAAPQPAPVPAAAPQPAPAPAAATAAQAAAQPRPAPQPQAATPAAAPAAPVQAPPATGGDAT